MRMSWRGLAGGKAPAAGTKNESAPSASRLSLRGGAASRSSFRTVAGLRSGSMRVLAGAVVLLALGVLAAPMAEAQTTPAVSGLSVTADPRSITTLDVKWNTVTGADRYVVYWKSGDQTYSDFTRLNTVSAPATTNQITGLTANTQYGVRVSAYDNSSPRQLLAQSEATATTNATAVEYIPYITGGRGNRSAEGATPAFIFGLYDRTTSSPVGAPPAG